VDKKNARRYDDCITYTFVASKKALRQAGLEKGTDEAYDRLDRTKVGVLVGSGMGGLTVFQVGLSRLPPSHSDGESCLSHGPGHTISLECHPSTHWDLFSSTIPRWGCQ